MVWLSPGTGYIVADRSGFTALLGRLLETYRRDTPFFLRLIALSGCLTPSLLLAFHSGDCLARLADRYTADS